MRWSRSLILASLGASSLAFVLAACSGDDVTDIGGLGGSDSGLTDHSVSDSATANRDTGANPVDASTGTPDTGSNETDSAAPDSGREDGSADAQAGDTGTSDTGSSADSGNDAAPRDAGTDAAVTDAGACLGATDPATLNPTLIANGRAVVIAKNCAGCHQDALDGGGDAGLVLSGRTAPLAGYAYPPNLTPDRATGLGCWTNAQIVNAIENSVDDHNVPMCVMPAFSGRMVSMDDARAVAEFLRSLTVVSHQVPATLCPVDAGATDAAADAATDAASDAARDAATD